MKSARRATPSRVGLLAAGLACALALGSCAGDLAGSPTPSSPPPVLTPVPGGPTLEASDQVPPTAAPGESASAEPSPTEIAPPPAPATVACDGTDVAFPSGVLHSTVFLLPDSPPGKGLLAYVEAVPEANMPRDGWRLAAAKTGRATFVAPAKEGWVFATLAEQAVGSWEFDEGGTCDLVAKAPPALGFASWKLDPVAPPAADGTAIAVAAHEEACAGGQPPAGRALPPIVDETATTVTITLLVRRLDNADCQANPSYPVEITLAQPLGGRALLDGSAYPPSRRN